MRENAAGLAYLRTFPDFEAGNVAASEAFGLRRILSLLEQLGSPQLRLPILHLAGTKGKGSTAAALASILRASGYHTGLFTQPHLLRLHERFTIDGREITDGELTALLLERIRPAVARLAESNLGTVQQFEAQVALALAWFESEQVDAAVLETGLGGRLDGTNVTPEPLVTVLTPVGFDHMQVLGNTLALIAAEKAAIIKPRSPVVSAPQVSEARAVIEARATTAPSPLLLAARDWLVEDIDVSSTGTRFTLSVDPLSLDLCGDRVAARWKAPRDRLRLRDLFVPLLGAHQAVNAATAAVAAIVVSGTLGSVTEPSLRAGLAAVRWPGRMQILPGAPAVLLDGAHTAESAQALVLAIRQIYPGKRVLLLCGMQADKDIAAVSAPLASLCAAAVATAAAHPRAASPMIVADALLASGCPEVYTAANPELALELAESLAKSDDLILVTGSLYLVGAILAIRGDAD